MRNKYLLLGAASMLMLAACSEDIKGPSADQNGPVEKGLNLKELSAASQAGRVSLPGETRGMKADRLQLVAKIAPVSTAADHKWSATGIAIANGTAYVAWHSDHQAKTPADAWGGALDELNIAELAELNGAINPANVITKTQTSTRVKFNNVVADGTTLYFPLTCYNNGAVIGRLAAGSEVMDTIGIPGSSANAVAVDGNTLYAVTGYAGGAFSMPKAFNDDTKFDAEDETNRIVIIDEMAANYGGKYIADGNILRTDDSHAYLRPLAGSKDNERALDLPLVSSLKYAEAYDPANDEWYDLDGDKAAHYGKHTMTKAGAYTYVGAGKNGLRVYRATSNDAIWSNNTNTTAVCAATVKLSDTETKDLIFAATGAGLRVYEPFNGDSLPLYAFEVKNYDDKGMAMDAPNANQPEAGTTAHSSNFVAVDTESGLIFVACGQSGVYVFKLNPEVEVEKIEAGFKWDGGSDTKELPEGTTEGQFTVPAAPTAPEGKEFTGWKGDDGEDYTPGETVTLDKVVELTPVWKDVVVNYKYTLKFDGNKAGVEVSNLPEEQKSNEAKVTVPNVTPTVPEGTLNPAFIGWATDPEMSVAHRDAGLWTPIMPGSEFTFTAEGTVTLYAIWATNVTAGGNQGGVPDDDDDDKGDDSGSGGGSAGAGDVKPGTM